MHTSKPSHQSYWIESTRQPQYPQLKQNLEVEVVIVGGGIVGITSAYLLQKMGVDVALLEANTILSGVTGHTTAKVTSQHGLIYSKLIQDFGTEKAAQYALAQEGALRFIENTIEDEHIECDFTRASAFTYTENPNELSNIQSEVSATQKLGLPAFFSERTDLPFTIAGAVEFKNQAHFHPRKYLLALSEAFVRMGGKIYQDSKVISFQDGKKATVSTDQATVTANTCILATHFPILDYLPYSTRLTPKRSHVLLVSGIMPAISNMFITSSSPLFSIRPGPAAIPNSAIITGYEHITGEDSQSKNHFKLLLQETNQKFGRVRVHNYWSTQDNMSVDGVPFIGKTSPLSKSIYIATGFGGWGMTNGTVAGQILSQMVMGKNHQYQDIFDPLRIDQIKHFPNFISKNIRVMQAFFGDKLDHKTRKTFSSLATGSGKVMRVNGKKIAVYKSKSGKIKMVSPHCTHMGCDLRFNATEKSWDCPCHGSRFDTNGQILHGPAVKNLQEIRST